MNRDDNEEDSTHLDAVPALARSQLAAFDFRVDVSGDLQKAFFHIRAIDGGRFHKLDFVIFGEVFACGMIFCLLYDFGTTTFFIQHFSSCAKVSFVPNELVDALVWVLEVDVGL